MRWGYKCSNEQRPGLSSSQGEGCRKWKTMLGQTKQVIKWRAQVRSVRAVFIWMVGKVSPWIETWSTWESKPLRKLPGDEKFWLRAHCKFLTHSGYWLFPRIFLAFYGCLCCLTEKAMATLSSTLAWRIPWTEEPGRLQSMGSRRVRHDRVTSLSPFTFMDWRRKWQPTPAFLLGESQGRRSLVGCHLWGCTELDTSEATYQQYFLWASLVVQCKKKKKFYRQCRCRFHSCVRKIP